MNTKFCAVLLRWLKFNMVGAIGMGVQLGMLALLTSECRVDYLVATAAAVETTVLHNFVWHERFTWRDCSSGNWNRIATRLLRFHLSAGAISLSGNLLVMRLLVGQAHWPAVAANLVSIGACSIVNFLVADRWIFRRYPNGIAKSFLQPIDPPGCIPVNPLRRSAVLPHYSWRSATMGSTREARSAGK